MLPEIVEKLFKPGLGRLQLVIMTTPNITVDLLYQLCLHVLVSFIKKGRALVQWLKLPAWKVGYHGFEPRSCIQVSKKQSPPPPAHKMQYCGEPLRGDVACSASNHQGLNFKSCVWRAVSYHSSHHPIKVILAQFSLCVHKGGIKPHLFDVYMSVMKIY